MAIIRPVITDFSAGELSPRLAGRVDLPIYTKGAKEITNFIPRPMGGVSKRGGLQHCVAVASNSECRLIPWSVNNDIDLLIELSDHAIKFLDVSGGMVPAYLTVKDVLGSTVTITELREGIESAYGVEELWEVKYAQNLREITLVHPDHSAFYIKYESVTGSNIVLEYGAYRFSGNVAANPPGNVADELSEITPQSLYDRMDEFTSGTPYDAHSDSGGTHSSQIMIGTAVKIVSTIKVTRTVIPRSLYAYNVSLAGAVTEAFTVPDNASAFSDATTFKVGNAKFTAGMGTTMGEVVIDLPSVAGITNEGLIDMWAREFDPLDIHLIKYTDGTAKTAYGLMTGYSNSWVIEIVYFNAGASGATTTLTLTNLSSPVKCNIDVYDLSWHASGAIAESTRILDFTVPWMDKGKSYPCMQGAQYLVNGKNPIRAMRQAAADGSDALYLYFEEGDSDTPQIITRGSLGVVGSVGVIVTPFYEPDVNPGAVCYHQGRLCLGGSRQEPNVFYMSKVNDYSNFNFFEEIQYTRTSMVQASEWADPLVPETRTDDDISQQVGASSAIRLVLATDENEAVQWAVSAGDLIIGTTTTEWVVPAGSTAINVQAVMTSRNGSAGMQARFAGSRIIMPTRSRTSVRAYSPGDMSISPSISDHAEHMTLPKVKTFDFRQDPEQELYFVLDDGTMLRLSMSGDVPTWSRITTRTGDLIIGVACIQASDEDAVYCVVLRHINSAHKYFIERLLTMRDTDFDDRVHLDSATYVLTTAASPNQLTGFDRFGTETVKCVFKKSGIEYTGSVVFSTGVASQYTDDDTGSLTAIPVSAEAIIGFPFTSTLETFRIDSSQTEGMEKLGSVMHIRLYESGKFDIVNAEAATTYRSQFPAGTVFPYTGALRIDHAAPWSVDRSIKIQSSDNNPLNILVIAPTIETGGT